MSCLGNPSYQAKSGLLSHIAGGGPMRGTKVAGEVGRRMGKGMEPG